MKREEIKRLNEIEVEMADLCAELKKARRRGNSEDEIKSIRERAEGLCFDLENYYQLYRPVFMPEVSAETIKDFFALQKLFRITYADLTEWRAAVKARAATAGR